MASEKDKTTDIPNMLYDLNSGTTYKRMRFFGMGTFAKCYEIIDAETNCEYAGKIISKKCILKHNQKEAITQEVNILKSLKHRNIVKFHSFFEDDLNFYIVLELCQKRSMLELHERRKIITEYECRYYVYQIILGVQYLHANNIIHRDLKLGNLFLNNFLHVKIGDFGLATFIEDDGKHNRTLCGTPKYIAPEILKKVGYSFEVDIWSIGCVMYTLLVGKTPFETKTVKDTYSKIKKCEYKIPGYLRKNAVDMIVAMLQSNPCNRPTLGKLLCFEFLTCTPVPIFLPTSCLTMKPRLEINEFGDEEIGPCKTLTKLNDVKNDTRLNMTFIKNNPHTAITISGKICRHSEIYRSDIESLYHQVRSLISTKPQLLSGNLGDENTDPAAQPLFWISKWIDYSTKYGFGYQLCDGGIGVMFNDTTKLIALPNTINVHFINKDGEESYMTTTDYCKTLHKKMTLLSRFKSYMTKHLVTAGANNVILESDHISRMPHLHTWFRNDYAMVMHLTNGTVQLNFCDHMKIILCPRMKAITFIDNDNFRTYRFSTVVQHGCSKDLYQKIQHAHVNLGKMLKKML